MGPIVKLPADRRLFDSEGGRFTREKSLVRTQPCPLEIPAKRHLFGFAQTSRVNARGLPVPVHPPTQSPPEDAVLARRGSRVANRESCIGVGTDIDVPPRVLEGDCRVAP